MDLIDLIFRVYFLFLFVRLVVADTGQAAFNRPFRFVIKATDPALSLPARLFGGRVRPALVICLGALIVLRGLLFLSARPESLDADFMVAVWNFNPTHGLWWVARSFLYFFTLLFQFYAFALAVSALWPRGVPGDEYKRLFDFSIAPVRVDRLHWSGFFFAFSVLLAAVWAWWAKAGLLLDSAPPWWGAPLLAAVLVVRLIPLVVYLILAAVILGWLRIFGAGGWGGSGLESLAELFLRPFRPLKLQVGRFDLTPLVAILLFYFAERFFAELLKGVAAAVM